MAALSFPPPHVADPTTASDSQLLARFVGARDESAFSAIIERHGPMVLGVCRRVLGHHHDAEDAFQATFLVLAKKAGSLGHQPRLGSWLYGVAQRTALKQRGMRCRREEVEQKAAPADAMATPLAGAWQEVQQALDEEIGLLNSPLRETIILCYLEGKTHEEAARALGWPTRSMSWLLSRALGALRQGLSRRGMTLTGAMPSLLLALQGPLPLSPELLLATVRSLGAVGTASPLGVLASAVLRELNDEQSSRLLKAAAVAALVLIGAGALGYQALAVGPWGDIPSQPSCGCSAK